jgi:nucleotide-binding universal stress UspA family protein
MLEVMGTTPQDVQARADRHASAAASGIAASLRQAGFAAEGETGEGDPKVEIVEQATRWGADLIVVGSETERRFRRVLLGSVAAAVVKNASCSVLVLRVPKPEIRDT